MRDRSNRLRQYLLELVDGQEPGDDDLLNRFVAEGDASAFASLVGRHGPMVLAVCRRVIGHYQEAEDAFQATFLVLSRRAGAIREPARLANWLYGVAFRTAQAARRMAVLRRSKESTAAGMREMIFHEPEPTDDIRAILDRELSALPDIYRLAIVLCDLEGLSRKDAATRLGWSEGTLSGRLARARTLLARRLGKYGLPAASIGTVATAVSVPSALAEATAKIGIIGVVGEAVTPTLVLKLTEGVIMGMIVTKVKLIASAIVIGTALLATSAAGWQANSAGAADPPVAIESSTAAKQTRPASPRGKENDRIAELERERELLLKKIAQLEERLTKMEQENQARKIAAIHQLVEKRTAADEIEARAKAEAEAAKAEAAKARVEAMAAKLQAESIAARAQEAARLALEREDRKQIEELGYKREYLRELAKMGQPGVKSADGKEQPSATENKPRIEFQLQPFGIQEKPATDKVRGAITITGDARIVQGKPIEGASASEVDAFIRARLTEAKLSPDAKVDRRKLIRQAYLDVTGTPPTDAEIEAFEKDLPKRELRIVKSGNSITIEASAADLADIQKLIAQQAHSSQGNLEPLPPKPPAPPTISTAPPKPPVPTPASPYRLVQPPTPPQPTAPVLRADQTRPSTTATVKITESSSPKSIVVIYSADGIASDEKEAEIIIRILKSTIAPKTWSGDSGAEFLPTRKVFIVRQTAEVHEQLKDVLKKLQELEPKKSK